MSKDTVLFSMWSEGWGRFMPVTLVDYGDGELDLHCQTGDHHSRALELAKVQLARLGLRVREDGWLMAASGIYYTVEKMQTALIRRSDREVWLWNFRTEQVYMGSWIHYHHHIDEMPLMCAARWMINDIERKENPHAA